MYIVDVVNLEDQKDEPRGFAVSKLEIESAMKVLGQFKNLGREGPTHQLVTRWF